MENTKTTSRLLDKGGYAVTCSRNRYVVDDFAVNVEYLMTWNGIYWKGSAPSYQQGLSDLLFCCDCARIAVLSI